MRFLSLTVGGAVPFPNEITIQFPAAQKVAVTGDNGAGKSTLLDCIYIALYGDTTKPGGLYPLFPSKTGLVDLSFQYDGQLYRIRRMIDGVARNQKVWVYQNGVCLNEGKVGQAAQAIDDVIGISSDVFLASVYNAQTQKGNPLALKDGERRDLLSKVLGLGAFDEPYRQVSDALKEADQAILADSSLVERLSDQAGTIEHIQTRIGLNNGDIENAKGKLAEVNNQIHAVTTQQAMVVASISDLSECQANARRLRNQILANQTNVDELTKKRDANKAQLLDREAEIRQAALEYEAVTAKVESHREAVADSQAAMETIRQQHASDDKARRESLEADQKIIDGLHVEANHAATAESNAHFAIKQLEGQIKQLSDLAALGDVPCKGEGEFSGCALIANRKEAATTLETKKAEMIALMNRVGDITQKAVASSDAYQVALHEYNKLYEADKTLRDEQAEKMAIITQKTNEVVELLKKQEERAAALKPVADLLPHLELANEKIETYERELVALNNAIALDENELNNWKQRLDAMTDTTAKVAELERQLFTLKSQQAEWETFVAGFQQSAGQLATQLTIATDAAKELEGIKTRQGELAATVADLTILKTALGPKGAKALKIDSAGPAISHIANTLLAECFGSVFTIEIRTQKNLVSDDTEVRECLEFSIIDNKTGDYSPVEQKSGGEQQLIREVISLALCIYQRKQTGADLRTVIRDEACSALTEENTARYVAMLEKACEIGGFDQVFFVSHKKVAQGLADAVIHVSGGKVEQ